MRNAKLLRLRIFLSKSDNKLILPPFLILLSGVLKMANVTYGDGVSDENIHIVLQRIANLSNKDIHVHSGDRPAGHFVKGSKPTSLHIARRAADFHFKGMTDLQGFNFIKENMNKVFDQTEAYEVIQHRPGGSTQGPHLHIGRYGIGKNGYRRG